MEIEESLKYGQDLAAANAVEVPTVEEPSVPEEVEHEVEHGKGHKKSKKN